MFIAGRHALVTKAPEGRHVRFVSITDYTDSAREGDSVLPFAPEERYVYSSATHPTPALQRSAMWYCRTPLNP